MSTEDVNIDGVQITDFEKTLDALASAHAIKEEYKAWKKNAPFLYDLIVTNVLDQVSLTVEWFPDLIDNPEKDYTTQRLLLGTQSLNDEQNHVIIAEVRIPRTTSKNTKDGSFSTSSGKVEVIQEIVHDGDVHRARYMPGNPNIIATKSSNKDVCIFNKTLHGSKPQKGAVANPQLRLSGHTKEGYGLSWNTLREGELISGSSDNLICLWDISHDSINAMINDEANDSATAPSTKPMGPKTIFTGHSDIVEDVVCSPFQAHVFASCSDDKTFCIWDSRVSKEPTFRVEGHQAEINSISFNFHDENILATGSSDATAGLWDLRNITKRLHSFESHEDQIFTVQFSPFKPNLLATAGCDRRVILWDIAMIGMEQSSEDAEDGPPELKFLHAGHTDKINDFGWCPNREWLIASVADNEVLQLWEITKAIQDDDDDEDEDDDEDDEIPDDELE